MALRTRLIALLVPVLLSLALLAACAGPNSGATPAATATSLANPPLGIPMPDVPGTTASSAASTVEMGIGTYCWTQMCADKIGPVTKGTLQVSRGAVVEVAVPQRTPPLREVSASATLATNPTTLNTGETIWPDRQGPELPLSTATDARGITVDIDLAPGKYVLTVGMYFERGDIFYGVVLDVQ